MLNAAPRPVAGPATGVALAAVSACTFGTVGPATKVLDSAGLTAMEIAQARLSVAAVLLVAFVAVTRPRALAAAARESWGVIAVLGVFSFATLQTLCGVAVARIPVGVFVVLQFLAPVIVVGWLRCVRRVPQPRLVWTGTVVVLVGLLLVGEVWSRLRLDVVGVLAALGTAAALSVRFLVAGRALVRHDPVTVTALGIGVGAVALNVVSPVTGFPYGMLGDTVRYESVSAPVWVVVVWAAVVATLVAYVSGIAAQRFLVPSAASLFATLEVVAGAGAAYLFLGQTLTPVQCAGVGTVLAGVALAQRSMRTARAGGDGRRADPLPPAEPPPPGRPAHPALPVATEPHESPRGT
ncbi:EamA family transporter [Streptomyces flavofungini]|uniref:EamA family transporter n=1 Tax=Streptomyces flavofungini TaxID=68200 RepID=A0ABS0X7H5_9ACTN|nr:DMT family transporter [Streptomyces flavofungini]MBJ3809031.1 EamA family transporter [Streptomyces flavofungini]GHC68214.1 membrane protein [Streptomyces flavofungini]